MAKDDSVELCAVTLVMTNAARSREIARACRGAGLVVQTVGSISELECWPIGQIVVTDAAYVTPLWGAVGAREVVAFVDVSEGNDALNNGATRWLSNTSAADVVAATILRLGRTIGAAVVTA